MEAFAAALMMVAKVQCEFVMPTCKHEAIFRNEYIRTNRTSHTKIMRCFPHCCPDHRDRSYCGSPLQVRILSDNTQVHIDNRLVVYCRFRPVHIKSLSIGDRISVESVRSSLQSVDPSKGQWIESRRLPTPETTMFEIHPSRGRWFYPWGGVATVAMRSTNHVFEAVVFYHVSDTRLEVVAQTSSPKFKLKSFRRSETPLVQQPGPKQKPATYNSDLMVPIIEVHAFVETSSRTARTVGQRDTACPEQASKQGTTPSEKPQEALASTMSSPSNALDSILRWLHELPASSAGARLMLKWQDTVLEACAAQVKASSERTGLVPILSALESTVVRPTTQRPPPLKTDSPLDTVDAAVSVLLNEWLSVECTQLSTRAIDEFLRNGMVANRAAHQRRLSGAVTRAQQYVHGNSGISWSQLMAAVVDVRQQHAIPLDGNEFSFRSFIARTRERFIHQHQRPSPASKRPRVESSRVGLRYIVHVGLTSSAPVWTSRMEDMAIDTATMGKQSLSLLSVIQFWKHLSCLRLHYSPDQVYIGLPAQLSVASVFNSLVNDGSFTKLTLDGQYRWFNCLPSGEPTVGTTLMGYVVGDYVARATSAGTIHITTYLWPATAENATATAFAWHWTIDAASLASGSTSSVVSVVVESSSVCRSPHAMETMSMAEKLRCVGRWQHTCELRLVYNIQ